METPDPGRAKNLYKVFRWNHICDRENVERKRLVGIELENSVVRVVRVYLCRLRNQKMRFQKPGPVIEKFSSGELSGKSSLSKE